MAERKSMKFDLMVKCRRCGAISNGGYVSRALFKKRHKAKCWGIE